MEADYEVFSAAPNSPLDHSASRSLDQRSERSHRSPVSGSTPVRLTARTSVYGDPADPSMAAAEASISVINACMVPAIQASASTSALGGCWITTSAD